MKNPLTPIVIEPATFRFVAQHLTTVLPYRGPLCLKRYTGLIEISCFSGFVISASLKACVLLGNFHATFHSIKLNLYSESLASCSSVLPLDRAKKYPLIHRLLSALTGCKKPVNLVKSFYNFQRRNFV